MSKLKVDTILKKAGTGTITIGQSGDTISIPSGATLANSGTATGFDGGLVFINEVSSSSEVSNLTLDNVFTSSYTNYMIVGEYTLINGTAPQPRFQFRTGGASGSDLTANEYNYHFIRQNADSDSLNNHRATGAASCEFGPGTSNDSARVGIRITWTVYDPVSSTQRTSISGHGKVTATDGNSCFIAGSCDYKATTSVTGIKFYAHSDNVKNGHFRVYGIVDS